MSFLGYFLSSMADKYCISIFAEMHLIGNSSEEVFVYSARVCQGGDRCRPVVWRGEACRGVLVKRLHLQVNDIMGVDIETLAVG